MATGPQSRRSTAAFREVLDNVEDPNTDATTARKVTLVITVTPNEARDQSTIEVQAHSKLAPNKAERTVAFMKNDGKKLVAFEHNFRQGELFGGIGTNVSPLDRARVASGERDND